MQKILPLLPQRTALHIKTSTTSRQCKSTFCAQRCSTIT
uniref:Uncharacterized protein n=1 Tax=Parascaris equorum TaxID=6256 RepID=A0A914S7L5_PAREQ